MQEPWKHDQFKPGSEFNLTTRPSPNWDIVRSQMSNEPEANILKEPK